MKAELLEILCCPETHQPVSLAPNEMIANLNERISAQTILNRAGEKVTEAIDGGLIREDRKFLYVIRKEIPVMLIDQAIPLP
jgi:uncharacterized protein